MKIVKIFITGFRPFLHGNINSLDWDITKPISIICANNGIGKSSLLRELTPYPAISTNYLPTGKKVITIEHEHSVYVLTSDFTNKKAHSFLRDNVELNESGNTDIQQDLCKIHFGFIPKVQKLVNGLYDFCNIGRAERKQLFYELYPYQLSFIYDKFRKAQSKIREIISQRKLIATRKAELTLKLLDTNDYQELNKREKYFSQQMTEMNRIIIATTTELNLKSKLDENLDLSLSGLAYRIIDLYERFNVIYSEVRQFITTHNLEKLPEIADIISQIKLLEQQASTTTVNINELKDQINTLDFYRNNDVIKERADLTQNLQNIQTELNECIVYPDRPCEDNSQIVEDAYQQIINLLDQVNNFIEEGKVLRTNAEITDLQSQYSNTLAEGSGLSSRKQMLEKSLIELQERKETLITKLPPSSCIDETCPLRVSVTSLYNNVISNIELQQAQYTQVLQDLDKARQVAKQLNSDIVSSSSILPVLNQIMMIISSHDWSKYVLNDKDLITVLNDNRNQLTDRVHKILVNTREFEHQKEVTEELKRLTFKLKSLDQVSVPAQDVAEKLIDSLELKLSSQISLFTKLGLELKYNQQMQKDMTKILDHITSFYNAHNEFTEYVHNVLLKAEIEQLNITLACATEQHNKLATDIAAIQQLIDEQESLRDRLTNEIEPVYKKLTEQLNKYKLIEKALSPTSGIAAQRIIIFLNSLIRKINYILGSIWTYPMSLVPLSEVEECTFDFKVLINKRSELKDINMCSKGQKDIINLAFMLALCAQCKLGDIYPIQMDEVDAQFSEIHRTNLLHLIDDVLQKGWVSQLFMVNHYASLYSSFADSDVLCLSEEGIVVPAVYNTTAKIS